MNNKHIFTALAVVVVVIIGIIVLSQNKDESELGGNTNVTANVNLEDQMGNDNAPLPNSNTPSNTANSNANINPNANANANTNEPTMPDGNDVQVYEIVYNGIAYIPALQTIKKGDIVRFKNASDKSFWPASAPHPQHTNYPEFDPKKPLGAGETWQFTFDRTGGWGFHDHLNPSVFGKITVN